MQRFILDSGASTNVATEQDLFTKYESIPSVAIQGFRSGMKTFAQAHGMIFLHCKVGELTYDITFQNVLHVPGAVNIKSAMKLLQAGFKLIGLRDKFCMY